MGLVWIVMGLSTFAGAVTHLFRIVRIAREQEGIWKLLWRVPFGIGCVMAAAGMCLLGVGNMGLSRPYWGLLLLQAALWITFSAFVVRNASMFYGRKAGISQILTDEIDWIENSLFFMHMIVVVYLLYLMLRRWIP